jgi:sugar/nucleoside kinase (ribokinase family)
VRQASLVGALSVTRMGAQPSLPTADELARFRKTVGA